MTSSGPGSISFSPNIVQNMVKLMEPSASFIWFPDIHQLDSSPARLVDHAPLPSPGSHPSSSWSCSKFLLPPRPVVGQILQTHWASHCWGHFLVILAVALLLGTVIVKSLHSQQNQNILASRCSMCYFVTALLTQHAPSRHLWHQQASWQTVMFSSQGRIPQGCCLCRINSKKGNTESLMYLLWSLDVWPTRKENL